MSDTVDSKVCPWCGRDCNKTSVHPSEEVLKEYVRCMLGQTIFGKTFYLLDNTVQLRFVEPMADVALLIDERQKAGTDVGILRDIRLLATFESLAVVDEDTGDIQYLINRDAEERKDDAFKFAKAIKDLSERLTTTQLSLIRNCSSLFTVLCASIVDELVNKNFYEGVGLY